jgi:signal transduction histidine kinase
LSLSKFGVLPTNELSNNAFNLAITVQVLLASFALGDRIRQLQADKDKVQSSLLQQYEKYTEAVEKNQALQTELKSHEVDESLTLIETLRRAFYEDQEGFQSTQVILNQFAECGRMVPGIFDDLQHPVDQISVSHESLFSEVLGLETTLTNDLIAKGAPEEALKQLRRSFAHLNNKLEQIDLSVGRINSISKSVHYFTQAHPHAITGVALDEVLAATQTIVNNATKSFQVNVDLDKLPKLTCNPGQLCFTFAILLTNAAEALEAVKAEHKDRRAFFDGQIRVTGRLHKKGEQSGVLLAIEDNGGGIAKAELEGVFQPYSGNRGGSHMGMGLSICKLLVRQNRGNIEATESTYLGGARVEIFLPA